MKFAAGYLKRARTFLIYVKCICDGDGGFDEDTLSQLFKIAT